MNFIKLNIGIIILLLVSGSVFSQGIVSSDEALFGSEDSEGIGIDESALFGSDDENSDESDNLVQEITDNQMNDLSSVLLTSDSGVDFGGNFFFDTSSSWTGFDIKNLAGSSITDGFSLDLGASVFLDARPDEDTRVFIKTEISSPFYTTTAGDGRKFEDIVSIIEVFADFNWNKQVFFRAGKQTVNWGVGHFFSPADLLSLSRIDPENPDADLDGPIALKVNYPSKLNNYYFYTVFPAEIKSYSDIAIAPMAEFVIGNTEISLGAYYQYDKAPAAMTAFTTALGDVSVYGEGYASYGSDKTFVADNGFSTVTYNDTLFYKATVGASYSWSDDLSNYNLSFSGQYYYNGEGYSDPNLVNMTSPAIMGLLAAKSISTSDLTETGRHYGALSASWRDMWGSDFSLSIFYIENFSSFSGMVKPGISWSGMDNIDLSLSFSSMFGDAGEEYSPSGSTSAVSLGVSIGGTSF
ncbi:MAG: hypothetical protein J7L71_02950 [Spirochaetaceae bacterium]|nr:hypothetical protein [Spirochaetaceae bacterium]